jgi:hypothetical protein
LWTGGGSESEFVGRKRPNCNCENLLGFVDVAAWPFIVAAGTFEGVDGGRNDMYWYVDGWALIGEIGVTTAEKWISEEEMEVMSELERNSVAVQ